MAGSNVADFNVPTERIEEATQAVAKSGAIIEEKKFADFSTSLQRTLAKFGGAGTATGAAQGAIIQAQTEKDVAIANIVQGSALRKEQILTNREQFLQNLVVQGVVSPDTGMFLRSRYDIDLNLQEINLQNQLQLIKAQGAQQQGAAGAQGLGTVFGLGVSAFTGGNPFAALANLLSEGGT